MIQPGSFPVPSGWRLGFPLLGGLFLCGLATPLQAGPPFVTDDPEPVDYQHWEVYLASQTTHGMGLSVGSLPNEEAYGTLPHLEVNYGAAPNLQLHVIAPDAFADSTTSPRQYGYGDTELGMKYRFIQQSDSSPEVGTFPLVEVPTGSASRGLGQGQTGVYLPVWIQKDFGSWTTYGGGGYWINPGPGNRNFWFMGWLLQKQVRKNLAIGAEVFHETAQTVGAPSTSVLNLGFVWDLTDHYHFMGSAGPAIQGPSGYITYLAIQLTFGPEEPPKQP